MRGVDDRRNCSLPLHHPDRLAGDVTAPEREVGVARGNWRDQSRVVLDGVLVIGVLDQDDAAGDMAETLADGVPLSPGLVLQHHRDPRIIGVPHHDVAGAVGRVAFDDDEFHVDVGEIDPEHFLDRRADGIRFVVDRHHDAQCDWASHSR